MVNIGKLKHIPSCKAIIGPQNYFILLNIIFH